MKTKLLTIIMLLCFAVQGFAQNNDMKARMEFEDAETAYQNQDYSKAVTHLESAEKLLGKPTGKTRYLLILSKANVFLNTEGYEYKDLEKLRGLCKHYLDNYTTDSEKYREIYDLSNVLNKDFPKTEQEYNRIIFEKLKEKQERTKKDMEQKTAEIDELKQAQNYVKSLAQKYGGFVSDITVDEFAKESPEHQKLVNGLKKNRKKHPNYFGKEGVVGPYQISEFGTRDTVTYYEYVIHSKSKQSKSIILAIIKEIQENVASRYYSFHKCWTHLDSGVIEDGGDGAIVIEIPGMDIHALVIHSSSGNISLKFYSKKNKNDLYDYEKYLLSQK